MFLERPRLTGVDNINIDLTEKEGVVWSRFISLRIEISGELL
jgi:hypothetical protein